LTSKKLYLKEEKRKQPFIIYEDENGTSVLTGYNLCLIDKLNELFNKVDVIIVDSFLHDEK
jgi:hypothetical protein